jgi:hypothetical protein
MASFCYIYCLVAQLNREFEHISYTIYFKSKTTSKSSILNHTYIGTSKPLYCYTYNKINNMWTTSNMHEVIWQYINCSTTCYSFQIFIVKLFELALSTVTVKLLSILRTNKQISIVRPIVSPLWLETWQKFRILLFKSQPSSIQWTIKHI